MLESELLGLRGVKVLVVEDDADSRELVARLLRTAHVAVTAVESASEALTEFRRHRPDVLVSDIAMPGMDGYDLLEEIRQVEQSAGWVWTPALALTALTMTADLKRAGRAGYQRHLGKPFEPLRLLQAVAELAGRAPPRAGVSS